MDIGPESADVATLSMAPSGGARVRIADALASKRSIDYVLQGTLSAAATDGGGARSYDIDRSSALSPVPGLPGVLR